MGSTRYRFKIYMREKKLCFTEKCFLPLMDEATTQRFEYIFDRAVKSIYSNIDIKSCSLF